MLFLTHRHGKNLCFPHSAIDDEKFMLPSFQHSIQINGATKILLDTQRNYVQLNIKLLHEAFVKLNECKCLICFINCKKIRAKDFYERLIVHPHIIFRFL